MPGKMSGVRRRNREGQYPLSTTPVPSYPDHEELHPTPSPPPIRYKLPKTPPPPSRKLPRDPSKPRSLPVTPKIVKKSYIRHRQINIPKPYRDREIFTFSQWRIMDIRSKMRFSVEGVSNEKSIFYQSYSIRH